jgi:hypothetical protein
MTTNPITLTGFASKQIIRQLVLDHTHSRERKKRERERERKEVDFNIIREDK